MSIPQSPKVPSPTFRKITGGQSMNPRCLDCGAQLRVRYVEDFAFKCLRCGLRVYDFTYSNWKASIRVIPKRPALSL